MASLAEIRAKLKEQENRSSGNTNTGPSDNAIYPFWNMKEGEQATLRFLPDGNADNTFFWVERLMIKLPFAGVKGETAVLTMVEKDYGEEFIEPAKAFIEEVNNLVSEYHRPQESEINEFDRIKQLAGI